MDATPSINCLYETTNIISKYIYGSEQIKFDFYHYENKMPNFSNENLNIELPIFIINGNHDYPANEGKSILELGDISGQLNYFGKSTITENEEILVIRPLRFIKGKSKIALYGLSYVKDKRLYKMFEKNKIKFEEIEDGDDYFKMIIVHQNRYKGCKGEDMRECISLSMIPDWFNLVIWGHEHECVGDIESIPNISFNIYQPGSTIATNLIEAEAKRKGMGLI